MDSIVVNQTFDVRPIFYLLICISIIYLVRNGGISTDPSVSRSQLSIDWFLIYVTLKLLALFLAVVQQNRVHFAIRCIRFQLDFHTSLIFPKFTRTLHS